MDYSFVGEILPLRAFNMLSTSLVSWQKHNYLCIVDDCLLRGHRTLLSKRGASPLGAK